MGKLHKANQNTKIHIITHELFHIVAFTRVKFTYIDNDPTDGTIDTLNIGNQG